MSVIGLVATLKVQPEKADEFAKVFGELRAQVKANEKGCLQYDFFKSKSEEGTFIVMEQYATQADLDAHGKTDYFKAAGAKFGSMLAGAPSLVFADKVE
ncbi:MAG: antibiotic biosynthesis monooxygenase [Rhizobiales bacterium]|nr:antibiotic biosynthesis monooxygenase [Hyphomicrobiales bacterium]